MNCLTNSTSEPSVAANSAMPSTPTMKVPRNGHAYVNSRRYTFPGLISGVGDLFTGSFRRCLRFVDSRDVDAYESDLAEHVHGGDHRLVRRARIGAHRDGLVGVGPRDFEDRGTQGIGRGIDELAVIDAIAAALRHRHH